MVIKKLTAVHGAKKSVKITRLLGMAVLACLLALMGNVACQKVEEAGAGEETGVSVKEGIIEFEGTVKVAEGKYMYIPQAQGFDIVVLGSLGSGELSSLMDKEVRGRGEFIPETPSILVASTIEVNENGVWRNVFTKSEDVVLDDYLDQRVREEFQVLDELSYDKSEYWEKFEKGKVQGKLEETDGAYKIVIFDDRDRPIGQIIVDNISEFTQYYMKKLGLFDRFWFYFTVKATVDWSVRRRSRDMFHADVLFAGLF